MTIQDYTGGLWTPWIPPLATGLFGLDGLVTMDASTEKITIIITIPKDGTLDYFEFATGDNFDLTGGSNIKFSFQNLDSSGKPDGTPDQYYVQDGDMLNPGTWTTLDSVLTDDGTISGVKRTVTRGQRIACVIQFDGFVGGDIFDIRYVSQTGGAHNAPNSLWFYNGTAWAETTTALPVFALKYDDDTFPFIPGCFPINTSEYYEFNNTDVSERGIAFSFPAPVKIGAIAIHCESTVALPGPAELVIYDKDFYTELDVVPMEFISSERTYTVTLSNDILCDANDIYRAILRPTSSDYIRLYYYEVERESLINAIEGGSRFYITTRPSGGSWSDETTRRPWMSILVTALDHQTGEG